MFARAYLYGGEKLRRMLEIPAYKIFTERWDLR